MAIRVSCPSCKSDVHVDESLAGKEILCPSCKERMSVPSIAAGQPETMPRGVDDEEGIRESSGRGGLPRWGDDEYEVPTLHNPARWNATLTGLAIMFWSWIPLAVVVAVIALVSLIMSDRLQQMVVAPGAAPPPEAMGLAMGLAAAGCVMLAVLIVFYVGMCMCCTAPAESGARGRAISAVVLLAVTILGTVVASMAVGVTMTMQGAQNLKAGGQMQFSATPFLVITLVSGVGYFVTVTMWLLFHKAIANYFGNKRLSTACIWLLVAFAVYGVGHQVLQYFANPFARGGNLMAMQVNTPAVIIAQIWSLIWTIGLSIGFLLVIRETRRTIREDEAMSEAT